MSLTISYPRKELLNVGLSNENVHYQLTAKELEQDTLRRGEGMLSSTGALVIHTGKFTGRSPKDKYIVRDESTANTIHWNDFNISISEENFVKVYTKILEHLNRQPEVWVRDCYACADPRYRLGLRVINEKPSTNLFAYNMFIRPDEEELDDFFADWHLLSAPDLLLDPVEYGTRQQNAAIISFKHRMILIAGTGYTGETKKSVFTVLNYLLPQKRNVLSMHCSANLGRLGDTALFFGLSGTGKTTLSADPARKLIGDDEHGWTNDNVFNFEGGCYAKVIDLTEEKEPDIFNAIRPGALVENTTFKPGTIEIDFASKQITENTRVSYPLEFIRNSLHPSIGNIPTNIFFLTCDASGVLPPISRLSAEQAMYQFISGYTAKVAGTETGITEPKATFSACFGAPFLPLHPGRYAAMLGEKLKTHNVKVWLVNTGWTGGSYGIGSRIRLSYTRAMISAALDRKLNDVVYKKHDVFGIEMPCACPGVPSEILDPRNTWPDTDAYDKAAQELAHKFVSNFEKYKDGVGQSIIDAGPTIN